MLQQFDKAAQTYNDHATIQEVSAHKLVEMTASHQPLSILDIGCGSGVLTSKIAIRHPNATIDAIDRSPAMINQLNQQAIPNLTLICNDYIQVSLAKKYDLIVSNAALHWMDVHQSFQRIASQLKPDGNTYLAIFGAQTSVELAHCLPKINRHRPIITKKFLTHNDALSIGEQYFSHWEINTEVITIPFKSVRELLKTQKMTGVNQKPSADGLWTPRSLQALEQEMMNQYGQVQLSYEIHFCKGDHNQ